MFKTIAKALHLLTMRLRVAYSDIAEIRNQVEDLYPTGAIYITTNNKNPSSYLGGEWELIDKEFKAIQSTSGGFNLNTTNAKDSQCYYTRAGHTITFELRLNNKVNLTDTTLELGTIDLEKLGVTSLDGTQRIVGYADGGNCCIMFNITQYGVVQSVDIIPESSMSSNSLCVTFTSTITKERMLDSACDKFYWRKT